MDSCKTIYNFSQQKSFGCEMLFLLAVNQQITLWFETKTVSISFVI